MTNIIEYLTSNKRALCLLYKQQLYHIDRNKLARSVIYNEKKHELWQIKKIICLVFKFILLACKMFYKNHEGTP